MNVAAGGGGKDTCLFWVFSPGNLVFPSHVRVTTPSSSAVPMTLTMTLVRTSKLQAFSDVPRDLWVVKGIWRIRARTHFDELI